MNFLSAVCIAAICTALFRILVPENKYSKQISLLIAAVFLLTGISAATGAEISLDTEAYDIGIDGVQTELSGDVGNSLRQKICKDMSDKIYGILNGYEIYPEEIHVIVNISGLYSIDITQVKLVFGAGEQAAAEAAAELLARELSKDITVTVQVRE